jgi:hypothetical protein
VATALAVGIPGAAAWCFAASALAWFLLYEPAAVLLGVRGDRLRLAAGSGARLYAVVVALVGALLGVVALILSPPAARLATLVPAALALLLVPVVLRGKQKTLAAEILVVATLAAVLLPVAAAAGMEDRLAWMAFGVWLVSYGLITLLVHAVKAHHKQLAGKRWTVWATPLLAGLTAAAGLASAATRSVPPPVGLALLPAALFVLVVSLLRVHPRKLRVVGWSVVGVSVLTLVLLLLA